MFACRITFIRAAAAVVMFSAACDSATGPDPRIPPAVGTPTSMRFEPCAYVSTAAQCRVTARWGGLYSTSRNVTVEGSWSSSAPTVVRVVTPGLLEAGSPGDADITVLFDGQSATATFRVFADGPPWFVLKGRSVEFHVTVEDNAGVRLDGVLVEIIAGAMAGRSAVSTLGRAIFVDDVVCGPITVRATKAGYREWTGSAVNCGNAGNGAWGSESVGPVRMIPLA